jgi:hypothetical protein
MPSAAPLPSQLSASGATVSVAHLSSIFTAEYLSGSSESLKCRTPSDLGNWPAGRPSQPVEDARYCEPLSNWTFPGRA